MLENEVGPIKRTDRISKARWLILVGLLLPFSVLTYRAVTSGSPGDRADRSVVLTTLATITGPFVGAIARDGQSCCLSFSLGLLTICGPALALGLVAQVVPLPFQRGRGVVRLVFWTLGWLLWLMGGPVSLMHALF